MDTKEHVTGDTTLNPMHLLPFLVMKKEFSMVDTKKCWSWKDVIILIQVLIIFLLILIICIT